MSITNTVNRTQTILVVSDEHHDLTALKSILCKRYHVADSDARANDLMVKMGQAGHISAAIICATDAVHKKDSLFSLIQKDKGIFTAIPILIYCGTETDFSYASEFLKSGARDIINPPLHEEIVFNRIDNAIRLNDSATFFEIERMLKTLPSNIYLKDDKGKYVFATHYWNHINHDDDPNWSIRGKTDLEIRKDKKNAEKAYHTDIEILNTGIGKRYIIEENIDGSQQFLELIKEPVKNEKGEITGIIALINDITEKEQLRIRLEQSAFKDELTGIRNNTAYSREVLRLNREIEEGKASFGLAIIDLNFLKRINDTYGHEKGNAAIKQLSTLICDIFKHSPVFRFGGDEFIVILENDDLSRCSVLCGQFFKKLKANEHNKKLQPWEKVSAAIGTAVFDGDTDKSVADVFARADEGMYACKKAMKAEPHANDSPHSDKSGGQN